MTWNQPKCTTTDERTEKMQFFFFFHEEYYFLVWMYHGLFIHSITEGHPGHFYALAVRNKPANIFAQVLCRKNFQLTWVNIKDGDCWIV